MALSISQQIALVAEPSASVFSCSHGRAASSSCSVASTNSSGSKWHAGIQRGVCAAYRAPANATLQLESPSSPVYSPKNPVTRSRNFSAGGGSFLRDDAGRPSNSHALIDIEDGGDGSVVFRYGPAEDLWDFDKLLEDLCRGVFKSHTAASFVALVTELFSLPASKLEQRRMAKLLTPHLAHGNGLLSGVDERFVSNRLAQEASKFLPPATVGTYRKGGWRPRERIKTAQNEWWREFDNFLGVGGDSLNSCSAQSSERGASEKQALFSRGMLGSDGGSQSELSSALNEELSGVHLGNSPRPYTPQWYGSPRNPNSLGASVTVDMVPERDVRESKLGISGLHFLHSAGDQRVRFRPSSQELKAASSTFDPLRMGGDLEPLPISSIQAMVDWEQANEMLATGLPDLKNVSVKNTEKKSSTKVKSKKSQGSRGAMNGARAPKVSRKKNVHDRAGPTTVYDVFCALPLSHKASGVAAFLEVRKAFSGELPLVLNHVAVGLAATGLALTLQVGARMLCLNATFDIAKMFGIIRGASLVCLSAAIEGVRKSVLLLPPDCRICDIKDKTQLLCLQQRLRRLTSAAMTVMVLVVVGSGV